MRPPGRWLRTVALRLCAKQTIDRLVDPVLADIRTEHVEAGRAGRRWRAAWVCVSGYSAFWKAIGLYTLQSGPRLVWKGIATDAWTLGRIMAYSLAGLVAVTVVLASPPMIDVYSRRQLGLELTLLLLPQAIPLGIPVALPLGIVYGMHRDRTRVSAGRMTGVLLLAIAAALLAFAAMLIVPVANQAFRAALARKLDLHGTTYSLPRGMTEMSLSELASRSNEYHARGLPQDARKFTHAYHIRFALPAATLVMSLLAVGICRTLRGRARRVVAIVIALTLYWAILAIGERNVDLPATVSVWAPNIVFTAISLALLEMRPRRFPQPDMAG